MGVTCAGAGCEELHPREGPTLEEFMEDHLPWEGPALEEFMEDHLPWEGPALGQGQSVRREERQRQRVRD